MLAAGAAGMPIQTGGMDFRRLSMPRAPMRRMSAVREEEEDDVYSLSTYSPIYVPLSSFFESTTSSAVVKAVERSGLFPVRLHPIRHLFQAAGRLEHPTRPTRPIAFAAGTAGSVLHQGGGALSVCRAGCLAPSTPCS